jgi:hypothetical protein
MKSTEGKLKLRSHNTGYCLIEVVTKVGLTIIKALSTLPSNIGDLNLFRPFGFCAPKDF